MTNFDKVYECIMNALLVEKKKKFKLKELPTQADILASSRSPIHKPTKLIKPKKGGYDRKNTSWKKDY